MRSYDCGDLISGYVGQLYAHEYDAFMGFFKHLGLTSETVALSNVPRSWVPFVRYLGHDVVTSTAVTKGGWEDAERIDWTSAYEHAHDKRRIVEMASVCRPELVHALYCADTEWPCPKRASVWQKKFVVTCNGSFFRPEVQAYRRRLAAFDPVPRSRAVLVPCAASKPYPSNFHRAVMAMLPDPSWHVIVATGVLGLLPQELWTEAPEYDSGLPYLDRVTQAVRWYFTKHRYERVVVFSDFYAYAIATGFKVIQAQTPRLTYVFGEHYRDTYENLMLGEHLNRLEEVINS